VSIHTKLVLGTVLVVAVLMAAVTGVVERRQRRAIVGHAERQGTVLAENLVAISTGPLLLYHYTALEQNVARLVAEFDDVTYAIIHDREGTVAAHGGEPGVVEAVTRDPVAARALGEAPAVQEVQVPGGRVLLDVAAPILVEGQRWGTARIGLSRRRMEAQIAATRRELLLLAAVALGAGAAASALVARRIARPVGQLTRGVAAIARGELDHRIVPATSDELGALALAFNDMGDQLLRQRGEIEAAHAALRQRYAELSDLKSYTDHILRSLATGLVTLDLDGRVVMVNPAAEGLTGCVSAAIRGRPAQEAFAHCPELGGLLLETLRTHVGLPPVALHLRPGAGGVTVEVSTTPLRGAEGQALGVVAVLRDLTTVRQLEEQLRRSDRLAALGTLAAGLAHEIKNPLTVVMTFSQHLARRFGDERFRQRFQSVVPRELERINGIVDGLLRLARPGRLTLAPVHLSPLVDEALELFADQMEARGVRAVREYALGLPPAPADREQLYQAMVNLITNALDAMPHGGTLTVRVALAAEAADGRGGARPRLRVEVQDTGAGIRPDETQSLFNPFFTTKPAGTGLGLAITHKIVEDHGGAISVRSAPGEGASFVILLPLLPERRPERAAGEVGRAGAVVS
jgi:two-component system sensor histidine kinase AtoS